MATTEFSKFAIPTEGEFYDIKNIPKQSCKNKRTFLLCYCCLIKEVKLEYIYVLCILAKKKNRKGKLESNEIGYLWLGPELKEWEDENGSEE